MKFEMPPRIAKLPQDERGFPIPWNILIGSNGRPMFTVNDSHKATLAISLDLCPICGETNDEIRWFVGGPQSAFHPNGWYIDLPGHEECEEFALTVCPYLAAKDYRHRTDLKLYKELADDMIITVDYTQDPNRPIVFVMLGATKSELSPHGYIRPIKPFVEIRYWCKGVRLDNKEGERLSAEALKG